MYRLNPFVHQFNRESVVALYNSITLSTLYIEENFYNSIVSNPPEELIQDSFFVDENFNASLYFYNFSIRNLHKQNLGVAYFLVTSSCNFKCEYCFVETRFNEPQQYSFMSKDVALKGLELLERNTKEIKIIFYGGEPFLNFAVIKDIVNEAKRKEMKTQFTIISNGSIISNEIISFIKENNVSLSISLDGSSYNNDLARKFQNGKGTFNRIKSTLNKLKRNGINFGISCTVSPYNVNNLEEIIKILDEFNVKSFGFNLLTENNNIVISEEDNSAMINSILSVEDLIFEKRIIEDRVINRKLKPFIEKTNWLRDCAGYGQQIVISPKGEVGTCHGLWPDLINGNSHNYFDIDVSYEGKITDHPTWKEWNNRIPFNMPQCWNCFALGLCGGGCAKNSLLRKGSIWEIDDYNCALTKESIKWVIWKYYDSKHTTKV